MYSKIKTWRVKNFRNIGDVTIDFTQSPIVTLIGENEAGKTSIVKTFAVLGCNADQNRQKDYVRDGMPGFGICAMLEDDTNVFRFKTKDTNEYRVEKDGKVVYETTKIDKGFGVPVEVDKVMGLIIEPETKELLQVRTYEDQLLFVLTKGSENYKVMYNALKVENITAAIKDGNTEANEDKRVISNCEVAINTLEATLHGIRIVDISNAVKVKERIQASLSSAAKLEKAISLMRRNDEINKELGTLALLDGASEIPEMLSYKLSRVDGLLAESNRAKAEYSKYESLEQVSEISAGAVEKMQQLFTLIAKGNSTSAVLHRGYEQLEGLSTIDISGLSRMEKCLDLSREVKLLNTKLQAYAGLGSDIKVDYMDKFQAVFNLLNRQRETQGEVDKYQSEADAAYDEIKNSGVLVANCPRCGETVIMDTSL